ncbi:nucleotidyltransferase family protein [Tenacibaculum sp. SZ-18]|uniref:nucleotidyltransferase family protein n=1 Tax=Tenacibaculum sp. SZ-18 TaxID=754423 RepID=UPI0018E1E304|nr:nucleotidyltransferase family protein [Tenacibaculum sp. SZ-18]
MSKKVELLKINHDASLIDAMKQMDRLDKKSLLVFNQEKFLNIISIGDIQRAIIKNVDINASVFNVLRSTTRIVAEDTPFESIKEIMKEFRTELMPVVDDNNNLVDVYFWEDVFLKNQRREKRALNLPVVIMAGGFGTRLRPLTHIIPKPLIPIGEESMIEHIIGRFQDIGCNEFYTSVNYKARMIEFYFNEIKDKTYKIEFFKEDKPLGTAGSLSLLKGKINSTFFVSNCDIFIEEDYCEIYDYHKRNKNELTIVSAVKNYNIPYGTLVTKEDGVLEKIEEKPNFNFQINTGFYIVEPHLIDEIPENEFFHITHLMEKLLKEERKIGVFPVSSGSWKDIGVWSEYLKNIGI